MNNRLPLIGAGINGFIAVSAGAFGAHALAERLSATDLAIWQTASQYQMTHALAILALVALPVSPKRSRIIWCWLVGTILFSGSLYLLVLSGIRKLGMITPLGGLCYLLGWAMVFAMGLSLRKKEISG